ncbi:hypothetical protein [Photobacterium leiognathi]|uniref:hypothetical protein n=1 Tax=Photobacterium leiognathi TaxID=553611 RepID=UPI001EDE3038|nr:hypothetical protein [Photobacterium leiognathi]MCG3884025.1 hypothetical protein [Photobacterium leiognathi]
MQSINDVLSCLANICTILGTIFAFYVYCNWKNNEISKSRVNCLMNIAINLERLDKLVSAMFSECVIAERNGIKPVRLYYKEKVDLIIDANKLIENIDSLLSEYRVLNINDRYKDGIDVPDVDAYTIFFVKRLFSFIGTDGYIEFFNGELKFSSRNYASNTFGYCSSFAELSLNFGFQYKIVNDDITEIIKKY